MNLRGLKKGAGFWVKKGTTFNMCKTNRIVRESLAKKPYKNSALFGKSSRQKGRHAKNFCRDFHKLGKPGVQVPSTWYFACFASMEKSVIFETKKEPKHLIFSGFTRFASIVSWLYGADEGT
ncbi:MAG: hypothetical protein HDT26_05770 [Subdoligranulum sp.]|nr:hypothetical protein [Subdoligranulum sp.]